MFDIQSWSKEFVEKANTPLTGDVGNIFMQMVLAEGDDNFSIEDLKKEPVYQFIDTKSEEIGLAVSEPVKVSLFYMTQEKNSAMMYLYVLRQNYKEVMMNELAQTFPRGYLSKDDLQTMWNKQANSLEAISFH